MAITVAEKTCVACGELKPLQEFHRSSLHLEGRHPRCKVCKNAYAKDQYQRWTPEQRERNRARITKHRYGLQADLVDALYQRQEGCCAICGVGGGHPIQGERTFGAGTLTIDHDHETGAVRGLLCGTCNSGIGKLGDSVALLVKAAAYLADRGGQ